MNNGKLFYYWSVPIFTILSFAIAISSLLTVVEIERTNLEYNQELKSIDLMNSFQSRYDKIIYDYKKEALDDIIPVQEYYNRFWNLQLEQWQYFNKGYIDGNTYCYWMKCRYREFQKNEMVKGIKYEEGFKNAVKILEVPKFKNFMNNVFSDVEYVRTYVKVNNLSSIEER